MPTPTPNQPTDGCLNGIVNFELAGISNGQAHFMVETEGYYGTIYHSNKITFAVEGTGILRIMKTLMRAQLTLDKEDIPTVDVDPRIYPNLQHGDTDDNKLFACDPNCAWCLYNSCPGCGCIASADHPPELINEEEL